MITVILAGGEGTRLKEITNNKMLYPFQGKPLVVRTVASYPLDGQLIFAINCLDLELRKVIESSYPKAQFLVEKERLGTGGWLKLIERLKSPFLVTCGDLFIDLDVLALEKSSCISKAIVTTVLTAVEDLSEYGRVVLDGSKISKYLPRNGVSVPGLAVAGVYLFSPKIFSFLPKENAFSLEVVLQRVAEVGGNYCYLHPGFWLDVGTRSRMKLAENLARTDPSFQEKFIRRSS